MKVEIDLHCINSENIFYTLVDEGVIELEVDNAPIVDYGCKKINGKYWVYMTQYAQAYYNCLGRLLRMFEKDGLISYLSLKYENSCRSGNCRCESHDKDTLVWVSFETEHPVLCRVFATKEVEK